MTGAELISKERERQINQEGWTLEHDDEHVDDELRDAAYCYLYAEENDIVASNGRPFSWPWDMESWKPTDKVRNLIKAGALIAAEIDRIQRSTNGSR